MSELSSPSRRAILTAPAAVVAVTAFSTGFPSCGVRSAQFCEYRRRLADHFALFSDKPTSDPGLQEDVLGSDAWEVLETERADAVTAAYEPIIRRKVRSWDDVIEIALVTRDQLFDGDVCNGLSANGQLETALMSAILTLANDGGSNV